MNPEILLVNYRRPEGYTKLETFYMQVQCNINTATSSLIVDLYMYMLYQICKYVRYVQVKNMLQSKPQGTSLWNSLVKL